MIHLIVSFICGVITFYFTLRVSDFFISRRERYVNSGFGIAIIKLGMAFTSAIYLTVWVYFILESY
jgi:hypothetical protein